MIRRLGGQPIDPPEETAKGRDKEPRSYGGRRGECQCVTVLATSGASLHTTAGVAYSRPTTARA